MSLDIIGRLDFWRSYKPRPEWALPATGGEDLHVGGTVHEKYIEGRAMPSVLESFLAATDQNAALTAPNVDRNHQECDVG